MTGQRTTWSIISLTAAIWAGCAAESRVLNPLPGPYHLDYCEAPSPVVPVPVEPAAEKPTVTTRSTYAAPHIWLPSAGIDERWTCIVIHHSDSYVGSQCDIDGWHRRQGWEHGCGYHFVIGNGTNSGDGEIEVSHRWEDQIHGAHTRLSESYARYRNIDFQYYNQHGIGIVLVGDFDEDPPTPGQLEALIQLLQFLTERCGIPVEEIHTHGEVDQTRCPGRLLDIHAIRGKMRIARTLSGGEKLPNPRDGT